MATPEEVNPAEDKGEELTPAEQDEMTIQQQAEIEKGITETIPLISGRVPLAPTLSPIYSEDPIYSAKVAEISKKFGEMRKIRPDGSCFYRAVLFRLFEAALETPTFLEELVKKHVGWKELLSVAGYTQFTVEDFYDNFGEALNQLEALKSGNTPPADDPIATKFFSSSPVCDYLTVFLRILTAAELVKNSAFYSNFLFSEDQSITEFIKLEVEPMGKEADHLQITALATAIDVGVAVVYMDRGDTTVEHEFPEGKGAGGYLIKLLYRPGHYDVVY